MSAVGRRILGSLSYANVVATLALFVALGGASYAAVVLPARSVGSAQLRAGAVQPRSLGFPLDAASVRDDKAEELSNGVCNGPLLPGQEPPPCVLPVRTYVSAGHQLHISIRSAGRLAVTAVAGLSDHGAPQAMADVSTRIIVDGRVASEGNTEMYGGQLIQVPAQALTSVAAGRHTIGLSIEAEYSARPENVFVAPVSIVATAFPPAN